MNQDSELSLKAREIIEQLHLQRHPEGGWYRETWRASSQPGERSAGTIIHFLLERHERSHWHRIDASEIWCHQAGGPLRLLTTSGGAIIEHRLGSDLRAGEVVQAVVAPGEWQAARTDAEWALVACVVVPGFEFAGFELAPPDWHPTET